MPLCKICGSEGNEIYTVREHMMNRGDEFHYLKCDRCGTLSLQDCPIEVSEFYSGNYYAQIIKKSNRHIPELIKKISDYIIRKKITIPEILRLPLSMKYGGNILRLYKTGINYNSKICDIGAGNGAWGSRIHDLGYRYVHCVDRFVDSTPYEGINFECCDIDEIDENYKYDLITLHHSFEHMENPDRVLRKIRRLLDKDGLCVIRIPLSDSRAFKDYKQNWYQIDAPRHYYLYSKDSIKLICERNGLRVETIYYDSLPYQFLVSSEYAQNPNISYDDAMKKAKEHNMRCFIKTVISNVTKTGDQAAIHIRIAEEK